MKAPQSNQPHEGLAARLQRKLPALVAPLLACSLFAGAAGAQSTNQITGLSPATAAAGTSGLTVTFTLDADLPPAPPASVIPDGATIGNLTGTSVAHPSQHVVTAVFDIPASQAAGALDAEVTFGTPHGTLVYSMTAGFTVTATSSSGGDGLVATYPVVDTAQGTSYNASTAIADPGPGEAFAGQDSQYTGNQPAYTVSHDGLTVYDGVTGLTWTRSSDLNDDGRIDADDKLLQSEAVDYAGTLNAQNFGGYGDWRLPSIKELYSLMDFRGTDPNVQSEDPSGLTPFIDTDYFEIGYGDTGAGERLIDSQFATTTIYLDTVMGGQQAMFGLNLVDGRIKGYPTSGKEYYVHYCRGSTDYGVNSFVDNGDGTITDHATGLMWQQADSVTGMTWEEALACAENLELGGYRDWRLPNAKELQSIVDYSRSPGTTSSAAIDPLFSVTQITNMAGEADYPWYWSSTTHLKFDGSAASGVYVCFGRGLGSMDGGLTIIDVHGAGCQRSDPKTGAPDDYPVAGHGPQGDVQRVFNHVRCVRGGATGPLTDTDGDGLTDWYEFNYAGDTTAMDPDKDDDADGAANGEEEAAGTIPTDSGSYLCVTDCSVASGGDFELRWSSELGKTYTIQGSADLATWEDIESGIAATPPRNAVAIAIAANAPRRCYRVVVE